MFSIYTRRSLALVLALVLSAVAVLPTFAETITLTDKFIQSFDTVLPACNGEAVQLTGEVLLIAHTTQVDDSHVQTSFMFVPRHISGVGLDTGTLYKAVGAQTQVSTFNYQSLPSTYTNASTINIVSQGGSQNLQLKTTYHVTVNANGKVTSVIDRMSTTCLG